MRNSAFPMEGRLAPLVSILTPTYNHQFYIASCLESVLSQSYPHWEQIIMDDGSTDETAEVIARFRDPRIRYVHQSNRGILRLAETYNRALRLTNGSLVATLEGDDLWPPDKLAALIPAFADPEVVVSYGVCRGFSDSGIPVPLEIPSSEVRSTYGRPALTNGPQGATTHAMLHSMRMVNSANASIIRRPALEAIGGFQHVPGLPVADYATFLRLSLKGKFAFTDRIMNHWRRHGRNATTLHGHTIMLGIYRYALEFADHHGHEAAPGISSGEIQARWGKSAGRWEFSDGRRLLAGEQWKAARARFRAAFRAPSLPVQTAALFGLAASYLHRDLEPLMGMAGRKPLARE